MRGCEGPASFPANRPWLCTKRGYRGTGSGEASVFVFLFWSVAAGTALLTDRPEGLARGGAIAGAAVGGIVLLLALMSGNPVYGDRVLPDTAACIALGAWAGWWYGRR